MLLGAIVTFAFPLGGSQAGVQGETRVSASSPRGTLPHLGAKGDHLIRLLAGAFDPLADAKPDGGLRSLTPDSALPAATPQYWLLQVADRRFADAQRAVGRAGGKIAGVVPDATYLVRVTPAQKAAIVNSEAVRWMGYYQPSWRFPVAAGGRPGVLDLKGRQTYHVYVFDVEPNPALVGRALRRIAGVKVVNDGGTVIDVRATAVLASPDERQDRPIRPCSKGTRKTA